MRCEECEECSEQDRSFTTVGVRFEAHGIEQFEAAMEDARQVVERLGETTSDVAEAMERLSKANKAARSVLHRPWWTSGVAWVSAMGWVALLLSLLGLAVGVGSVGWLVVSGVLALGVAVLSGAIASTPRGVPGRKPASILGSRGPSHPSHSTHHSREDRH